MLKYITHAPRTTSSAKPPVLLIMHGYGADERDLLNIAEQLDPHFLAISLQAPIPLSWGGFAWYHLQQTSRGILPDDPSRWESEELVTGSIAGILEKEGGDPANVILVGFSQGAAMCYSLIARHSLEHYGITTRAVAAMSGYLPRDILTKLDEKSLEGLPVFVSHGEYDDLIPSVALEEAQELLTKSGANVTAKLYPIGHGVSEEVIADLTEWMKTVDVAM